MKDHKYITLIYILFLAVLAAGCAEPTQSPASSSRALTSSTPSSSESNKGQEGNLIEPRESSACTNDVVFIEDLTVPDGTVFSPGEAIDKRWSVRNSGTCNWTSQYRLVRLDQDQLQSASEIALYPARAGNLALWQVDLKAPQEPGEYMTRWQARSPAGDFFGQEVFMIVLVESPGLEPTVTPIVTPTPGS